MIVKTAAKTQMRGAAYIAPEVGMIEIATEKGFAASPDEVPNSNPGGPVEEL